jgi:hypothetical protein
MPRRRYVLDVDERRALRGDGAHGERLVAAYEQVALAAGGDGRK